jgi:hypothetical protein
MKSFPIKVSRPNFSASAPLELNPDIGTKIDILNILLMC